jgi:hypothetical protein
MVRVTTLLVAFLLAEPGDAAQRPQMGHRILTGTMRAAL